MEHTSAKQTEFPKSISSGAQAIDLLLSYAMQNMASDIHCDPVRDSIVIMLRVDGILKRVGEFSLSIHDEFISRLKILSGARTDIHNIPQDGRWQSDIDGHLYNIRISFMPTYYGENAVLRLLPVSVSKQPSLKDLGFVCDHVEMITRALTKTSGLIIVTGPTGSGKTTTLHTCLSMKTAEPISIVTLEDPVEYEIPGVRQIHIRHTHGVTFASGLRAVLRQDPDVIMVGEIRDAETAHVAIHTALTGHLVLTTLHTNSALETIPRLIDMGVDSYLLAATLRLIVAQRLVRIVCRECEGNGCNTCCMSGYNGRTIIAEVCEIDGELSRLISRKSTSLEIETHALSRGFQWLHDDGMEKVDWGITTKEEIVRVMHS